MRTAARPPAKPIRMSAAASAIERAKARELMDLAIERAAAAREGAPFSRVDEAAFARAVLQHRRAGCPLSDAPARACWASFMAAASSFVETSGQRRGPLADVLEAAARAFTRMLDDTQLAAADAWKVHDKGGW